MNIEEYISGAALLIGQTPISPFPQTIKKIQENLDILIEKCHQPLKVVLMGASNSGKSTLLNALAGETVSPVDVRETTAVIIRAKYAVSHIAKIHFYDKEEIIGSVTEIFRVLEKHRNDLDFASSCREVEISLPLPALRNLEIVDTPGLGTLTIENQETTKNYIQQSDVILWTLHASYINNQTIEDEIGEVFDFGKPMICAVTHVDEIHATPEQVTEATEDAFPGYFNKIFPINAYSAYHAVRENNTEGLATSGFQALLEELANNYDNNSEQAQTESLLDSTQSLMIKARDIHTDEIRYWRERHDAYQQIQEDLRDFSRNIENKFTYEFEKWIDTELLQEETTDLLEKINEISFSSKSDKEEEIKKLWERTFSEKTIQTSIANHIKGEEDKLESVWRNEIKDLQNKVLLDYGNLILNKKFNFLPDSENLTIDAELNDSTSTIGMTTAISAVFGGAASAYAAGLGTYAAHLSMAGALGSFMPPVLLAGILVGLIKRLTDIDSLKKKWRKNVENAQYDVRRALRQNILHNYRGNLQTSNSAYATAIEKDFLTQAFGLEHIDEVDDRINAIDDYRQSLEAYMDEAPSYGDIIDHLHKRMEELLQANNDLTDLGTEGSIIESLKQMKIKMREIDKAKLHLEQELDKKENALADKEKELDVEKKQSLASKDNFAKLSRKLERNEKEKKLLEQERRTLKENYEKAQLNLQNLEDKYEQLKGTLSTIQKKASALKTLGINLDTSDALDKLETTINDVTDSLIKAEASNYKKEYERFKCQYPHYDENTLKDLATGHLLRKQFLQFKNEPHIDFSPALLPALVMIERILRDYYMKCHFIKNANKCPWANICNHVKNHEYHWRQGFGEELLALKDVRNQAVHTGNIDYPTYESSYKRIVTDNNSIINFIYFVVTS